MEQNQIKAEDIYDRKDYITKRPQLRKEIVSRKKEEELILGHMSHCILKIEILLSIKLMKWYL